MMTTIMFIGMSFCIPIGYAEEYWQRHRQRTQDGGTYAPLLNGTLEEVWSLGLMRCPAPTLCKFQNLLHHNGFLSRLSAEWQERS